MTTPLSREELQHLLAGATVQALLEQEGEVHLEVAAVVLAMVAAEQGNLALFEGQAGSSPTPGPPAAQRQGASFCLHRLAGLTGRLDGASLAGSRRQVTGLRVAAGDLEKLRATAAYQAAKQLANWLPLHNFHRLKALQRAHYREWAGLGPLDHHGDSPHLAWQRQLAALVRARRSAPDETGAG